MSADGVVAVTNPSNEIWYKAKDDTQNAWTKIPNWQATRVAVMSAHSIWVIGLDSNVYRSDFVGPWAYVGRTVSDLATSSDGTIVVSNAVDHNTWVKTGDNTVEAWSNAGHTALSVAAPGAGRLVVVGTDNNVWRK